MTADARPIRVLVVDDSAFARKVLREALSRSPLVEVVGVARDGLEALEKIAELAPDVVTLDLVMPNLDGLGVLRALPPGGPRVVVVSISDAESALGIEALEMGAVELVHKPTALATERLYELAGELVEKVVAAASARPLRGGPVAAATARAPSSSAVRLVAIGTSTGGPAALTRLLATLPGDLPAAVAVALHIPAGYTEMLARRLDEMCAVRVFEVSEGALLEPGTVAIARGGLHLRITEEGGVLRTRLDAQPRDTPFCPSVDVLLESAAALGPGALGVILTGMGSDGLAGAAALRRAGGRVLTEAETSCVVYGMPRAVFEAGQSDGEAPFEQMGSEITRRL